MVKILALLLTLLAVGYCGWKRPQFLIYFFSGSLFFDISRILYPEIPFIPDGLSLAKILTLALICAAGWSLLKEPRNYLKLKGLVRHPLVKGLLTFLALGILSFLYSVSRKSTLIEVIRLVTLYALFISVIILGHKKHIRGILQVVHGMGIMLIPLAIYEAITKHFLWYKDYANWVPPRVNATFVDPNIFARYVILAIIANLILLILQNSKKRKVVYLVCLAGLLSELAVTFSRSGMVILVIVLGLLPLLVPIRKVIWPVGLLGLSVGTAAIIRPSILVRFVVLKKGLGALDPGRFYLWRVAGAMIKDHPLIGVGLGAFQSTFETFYRSMMLPQFWVTRSHTTVLTITAELGILGLIAVVWIGISVVRAAFNLTRNSPDYILGMGLLLWIIAIFLSSQFEARLFEDPALWLSMSFLLVLNRDHKENNIAKP